MTRLLAIPSGRRAKWVVLAVRLIAVFGSIAANLSGKFSEGAGADEEAPGRRAGADGRRLRRDAGLTAADRGRIARDRATLNALALKHTTPFSPPQR